MFSCEGFAIRILRTCSRASAGQSGIYPQPHTHWVQTHTLPGQDISLWGRWAGVTLHNFLQLIELWVSGVLRQKQTEPVTLATLNTIDVDKCFTMRDFQTLFIIKSTKSQSRFHNYSDILSASDTSADVFPPCVLVWITMDLLCFWRRLTFGVVSAVSFRYVKYHSFLSFSGCDKLNSLLVTDKCWPCSVSMINSLIRGTFLSPIMIIYNNYFLLYVSSPNRLIFLNFKFKINRALQWWHIFCRPAH